MADFCFSDKWWISLKWQSWAEGGMSPMSCARATYRCAASVLVMVLKGYFLISSTFSIPTDCARSNAWSNSGSWSLTPYSNHGKNIHHSKAMIPVRAIHVFRSCIVFFLWYKKVNTFFLLYVVFLFIITRYERKKIWTLAKADSSVFGKKQTNQSFCY